MLQVSIHKDWWGQQSTKEPSNQQKHKFIFLAHPAVYCYNLKLVAWFSWNLKYPLSLNTVDNAEKNLKIWKLCKQC